MAQLDDPIRRPERRRPMLRSLPLDMPAHSVDPAEVVLLVMRERPLGDHAPTELHQRLNGLGVSLSESCFDALLARMADHGRVHRTRHGLFRLGRAAGPVRRTHFDIERARTRASEYL